LLKLGNGARGARRIERGRQPFRFQRIAKCGHGRRYSTRRHFIG
jgi:hypothetical protein